MSNRQPRGLPSPQLQQEGEGQGREEPGEEDQREKRVFLEDLVGHAAC